VLPSFTEGHPRVLIEALARKRPVIIFDEISHVKQNYIGVFICKREKKNFLQTIETIIKNFKDIQKKMDKNVFPTREKFATQLKNIIKV
jgi:Glycosyltransferase